MAILYGETIRPSRYSIFCVEEKIQPSDLSARLPSHFNAYLFLYWGYFCTRYLLTFVCEYMTQTLEYLKIS